MRHANVALSSALIDDVSRQIAAATRRMTANVVRLPKDILKGLDVAGSVKGPQSNVR